ncbi:hypothetical protein CBR_g78797 [Chara braunii]|uniref:Uncharacterized protein n=1 Tax=Chara braunii TaxID=69332 RepID=A0A388KAC6_CHABU|nr:hypothetical protein CBR_g78797 [Chara braunii]|eukprot:GBG67018.1 hypothetical protein CBR_g78797 [Chara braunii]
MFGEGANKLCDLNSGRGVTGNDTSQGRTLDLETEELLGAICEHANVDVEKGEATGTTNSAKCIVPRDRVTKTTAGNEFEYDMNWEPGKVQPGWIGAQHCIAFKSGDTWVPYRLPKLKTWRYITAAIVFDRVKRINGGLAVEDLVKYTNVLTKRLTDKGEIRLNDFFYDRYESTEQWVVYEDGRGGDDVCEDNDARRDARWGWVSSTIPCDYGEIRILVRDLMGNCWSTVYIYGEFISRCLDRDLLKSEKVFMRIDDAAGTQFTIPLENPVLSPIIEEKVFSGEDNICLRHVRGREVIYDGLFISIWDPDMTTSERVCNIDISGTVIPQNGLLHHIQYMSVEDMAGSDDNRSISEPHIARTKQPACEVNGPLADTDVCAANRPAEDTDAGCAVVDKSRPPSGTMDSDGSRKIGRGMKRKATSRRDNGGTPTLAQRGRGGTGKGGRTPMARGRGRGRGRDQGGAAMDGPGETRGKIGGSEGVQRRNRRPGEAAVTEMRRLQRSTDLCIAYRTFVRLRVVEWMCDDEDINKSKREGGVFYDRSAFKKFVTSRAKEARMLKTTAHDILKSNAAEILALSRMNELPQTDPVDYHDLATVVVSDVEYVLLDQIMDLMLKTDNDTNLIHEALHEVTEDAIAAAELADVESTKDENQLVSGTPICQENIFTVLEDPT